MLVKTNHGKIVALYSLSNKEIVKNLEYWDKKDYCSKHRAILREEARRRRIKYMFDDPFEVGGAL